MRSLLAAALLAVAALGATLLRLFPPTQYTFYPRCPFFEYLHVLCPGCGATRAAAALLSGDLIGALHWNAFFVALLPFLLAYAVVCLRRAFGRREFRWPQLPMRLLYAILAVAAVFTVARNLVV